MGNDGDKPPSRFDQPTEVMPPEEVEVLRSEHAGAPGALPDDTTVEEMDPLATLLDAPARVDRDLPSAPTDPERIEPPSAAKSTGTPHPDEGSLIRSAWPTEGGEPARLPVFGEPEPTEPDRPDQPATGESTGDSWDSTGDGWPTAPARKKHSLWDTGEVPSDTEMVTIPPDVMRVAPPKPLETSPHRSIDADPEVVAGRWMIVGGIVGLVFGVTAALVVGVLAVRGMVTDAEPPEQDGAVPTVASDQVADIEVDPAVNAADEPTDTTEAEPAADASEPSDTGAAEEIEPQAEEAGPESEITEEKGPVWARFPGVFPPHGTRTEPLSPMKLDRLLLTLDECEGPIRVIGHAATGGGPTDDEVLALARAEFAKEVLIDAGLPEDRLRARSAKPRQTTEDSVTEDEEPRARRVVLMCKP